MNTLLLAVTALSLFYALGCRGVLQEERKNYRREIVALRQRETDLVDRLMHISGNTWVLPPREAPKEDEEPDEDFKRYLEGWREV